MLFCTPYIYGLTNHVGSISPRAKTHAAHGKNHAVHGVKTPGHVI